MEKSYKTLLRMWPRQSIEPRSIATEAVPLLLFIINGIIIVVIFASKPNPGPCGFTSGPKVHIRLRSMFILLLSERKIVLNQLQKSS